MYISDECFVTGTMGELTPVLKIDGRQIGEGQKGEMTQKIQASYRSLTEKEGVPIPPSS